MSSIFLKNIQKIFVDKIEMIVGQGGILIKICGVMKIIFTAWECCVRSR